jgi:cardiolipin synthase
MSKVRVALVAAILSAVAVLVAFNLSSHPERLDHQVTKLYGVDDPQFERTLNRLFGPAMVGGNRITALHNGDEIFPAMLAAIRDAKRSITFEIYIYWKGEIGEQFTAALCERARAGVKTHVLLDWLGSDKVDETFLVSMREAGVQVERFRPLRWYNLDRMNNRSHRRLLVVDGKVGFTGGVGVADEWTGNAQDEDHWRDSQFKVEGPVVGEMQAAFLINWMKTRPELLHGEDYFPAIAPVGNSTAQLVTSSADDSDENARLMYMLAITSAERSVRIANAYFVPDELAVKTLVAAAKRGVKVEILVPGSTTDVPLTRRASRALWEPLLTAGIEISEYQPTMFHAKVMVVDDLFVSVGSTNFDDRSFRLNDEANLNVLDAGLAATETAAFNADLQRAKRVGIEAWRSRPLAERLMEHASAALKTQL